MTDQFHTHLSSAQSLDTGLAELLRPELPSLADEIVEEIRLSVPEFARPLQGTFGVGIRLGVEQGLHQFVDQIADPRAPQEQGEKVYRALGRGEYLEGRSLDALQAAYRVGARVAWRRFADTGHKSDIDPQQMNGLAETVFAYIEEISAHSDEAYTRLSAHTAGTRQTKRRRLLELILSDHTIQAPGRLNELAAEAQWRLPHQIACAALDEQWHTTHLVSPALDPDVLMDLERPDPYLLLPDPDGPGRLDTLRHALRGTVFALGPAVPLGDAPLSLRVARQALTLLRHGILTGDGYLRCEDHLPALLLATNDAVIRPLIRRRLTALTDLKPDQYDRLTETLLTWLATGGSYPDIAARLSVHAQTIRYRMHQLEDLFGDDLHDPGWRFEMQLALRASTLTGTRRPTT